jgi:hypothetical protein
MVFLFLSGLLAGELKNVFVTALASPFTRINMDYYMAKNAIF